MKRNKEKRGHDSGTSPGKNETRRNRDDDHDGLRFENYEKIASFSFFFLSSITLLHYFLIYSLKKRKLEVFERIKISFKKKAIESPHQIFHASLHIFILLSLLKERAKNWRGKNMYRKFDWNLAYVLAL